MQQEVYGEVVQGEIVGVAAGTRHPHGYSGHNSAGLFLGGRARRLQGLRPGLQPGRAARRHGSSIRGWCS